MAEHRFFDDDGFEFLARITLGQTAYGLSEAGEVVATVARIDDADYDSWFDEWTATAERLAATAEQVERAGHAEGARSLWLRAANYLGAAFFYVLGTRDPSRSLATWRRHRECFDRALRHWHTPVEQVEIPYEHTSLVGYLFSPPGVTEPRPCVILNNGSDGPITDMLAMGAIDAVARGYRALAFDGPGQGHALYEQQLYFRHDWEAVITPVVEFLDARGDVDAERIALAGVSQAGYWVPRAAAFEHRLAAAVADPGVMRVQTSWIAHLPDFMLDLYEQGKKTDFDSMMEVGLQADKHNAFTIAKRIEPYGTSSVFEVLTELEKWDLAHVASTIRCPILVTDPEDEQFWPGQSRQLYDAITAPKQLVSFTAAEGASWHCEPLAPQLRNQRIFDWLDDVLHV